MECVHNFVRTRSGHICIECGYEPGFSSARRRSRRRGKTAAGALAAVLAVAGLALVAGNMLGDPANNQSGTGAGGTEAGGAPGTKGDVVQPGAQDGAPGGATAAPDGASILDMMEDAKAEWNLGAQSGHDQQSGPTGGTIERVVTQAERPDPAGQSEPAMRATEKRPELAALYDYALELANEDRAKHGAGPVALSGVKSAQDHSDDMLRLGYFSHWDSNGVKPYATYTRHGGTGYVGENISYATCSGYCADVDPFESVRQQHWNMMYRDAHADWGHRDNIIDPAHTHVNFGISYRGPTLYFVQHFESNPAGWSGVRVADGKLFMEGTLPGDYGTPQISIYRDPPPKQVSARELDSAEPYSLPFYGMGEMAGMVVKNPSGGAYVECPNGDLSLEDGCVPYAFWHADTWGDGRIRLAADVSKWLGTGGLHTALVFLDGPDGSYLVSSSVTLEYAETP